MAGIRHQHAIAAGQAQIAGERSPFVAAFFLDDLYQQDLAAANDVLDFVATAQRHAFAAQIIGSSIAIPAFATRCGLLLTLMVVTALAIVLIVQRRSEEHTSELQSLMRISYAVFCLTKKKTIKPSYSVNHNVK